MQGYLRIGLSAQSRNRPAVSVTALVIGALLAVAPRQVEASVFTVTVSQVGGDVVASGSGSFDLTGLTMQSTGGSSSVEINPSAGELGVGDNAGFFEDVYVNNASFGPGLTSLGSYGSGGSATPSSGTTPDFLFTAGHLLLPNGYVSGTPFTDSSTYTGATFSSLGLTSGTYTSTWDAGANSLVLTVPEPASLALFGGGMVGLLAFRRRRAS
jgi:hypothetical protein